MFGSRVGFRGRRIERRYLRFEQIQDGGHRHVGKISSGDISTTGRPMHFLFCSRVGFSGTADLMALFLIRLTIYLYSAHRGVASRGHLCDSTAFLFLLCMLVI